MEAFIAENLSEGTVTVKADGFPVLTIKRNSEYMFPTPQEFFAFKPKLDILVQSRILGVKSISAKEAAKVATEQIEKRRDSLKNDHITLSPAEQAFNDRKIEVKSEAPTETPVVDVKATKAEIKALKDEFKTCSDKKRKDEIRGMVKELQAKL